MLLVEKQATPAWHEARRGRVTASVAGAILGVNPHMGQLAAYNQIMGVSRPPRNGHIKFGIEKEDTARNTYEAITGNLAFKTGFWVCEGRSWLGASPDGLIGDQGILEIKCPSVPVWQIPQHHMVQIQLGMLCTGRTWAHYFCWTKEKSSLLEAKVWSTLLMNAMISELEFFYYSHILTSTPPPRRRKKDNVATTGDQPNSSGRGDAGQGDPAQ